MNSKEFKNAVYKCIIQDQNRYNEVKLNQDINIINNMLEMQKKAKEFEKFFGYKPTFDLYDVCFEYSDYINPYIISINKNTNTDFTSETTDLYITCKREDLETLVNELYHKIENGIEINDTILTVRQEFMMGKITKVNVLVKII